MFGHILCSTSAEAAEENKIKTSNECKRHHFFFISKKVINFPNLQPGLQRWTVTVFYPPAPFQDLWNAPAGTR